MAARRCSQCGVNWPSLPNYARCPGCDDATDHVSEEEPVEYSEAVILAKRLRFDRVYAERGEQPLPPEYAEVVARLARAVDEIVALESIPVDGEPIPVPPLPPEMWGSEAHLLRGFGTL